METYKKTHTPGAIIKDVSLTSRKVTGYFASFGNVDSDGDVFDRGCFKKSIQENGPGSKQERIAYLYQHSPWEPVGYLTELKEDSNGLYFEADVPDTTLGSDVLKMYEAKVLKEHSVGFRTITENLIDSVNHIKEVRLWEGSVVTWGANSNTPFVGFKGMNKEMAMDQLFHFTKALKDGTFSNKTFHLLEIGLEQIKSYIDSLETGPEVTPPTEPNADLIGYFNEKLLNLVN